MINMRPTFLKILLYLLVKYLVFFSIIGIIGGRFNSIVIKNSENGNQLFENSFYYVVYVLVFSALMMLIFSTPIYFVFKIQKALLFFLSLAAIFTLEYFAYTYLASASSLNGIYNVIIGMVFLLIFFYKTIRQKLGHRHTTNR